MCRSWLNREEGEKEKRGSGVGGVVKRLGRAVKKEKAKRRMRGRSWTKMERGPVGWACCCCWRCRGWPVCTRVVRKPPGPNVAEKTKERSQKKSQGLDT